MYHIIVNPTSRTGKTKEIWTEIERYLADEHIDCVLHTTKYRGHATEIAREVSDAAVAAGEKAILLLVGGDGTANEVVNGISDFSKIRFGYVPTGSGNDLGRGLGISRDPVSQMKYVLSSDKTMLMDLGEAEVPEGTMGLNGETLPTKRKYTISAGIGLDADVCRQALTSKLKNFLNAIKLGSATYGILTVISLFSMPVSDAVLTVTEPDGSTGEIREKNMIFTAAMNHKWEGGGVPMAPDADATDGLMSMISVGDVSRFRCLMMFPKLLAAKHKGIKEFKLFPCRDIHIHLKTPMVVHADGEYCGTVADVTFRTLPKTLEVIV